MSDDVIQDWKASWTRPEADARVIQLRKRRWLAHAQLGGDLLGLAIMAGSGLLFARLAIRERDLLLALSAAALLLAGLPLTLASALAVAGTALEGATSQDVLATTIRRIRSSEQILKSDAAAPIACSRLWSWSGFAPSPDRFANPPEFWRPSPRRGDWPPWQACGGHAGILPARREIVRHARNCCANSSAFSVRPNSGSCPNACRRHRPAKCVRRLLGAQPDLVDLAGRRQRHIASGRPIGNPPVGDLAAQCREQRFSHRAHGPCAARPSARGARPISRRLRRSLPAAPHRAARPMIASISPGLIHSPPDLIRSLVRPMIVRLPSSSMLARSPVSK